MATPIRYTPETIGIDPASEQARELLEALTETGLLRAVTGAVRAYPELSEMLVDRLDVEVLKALATLSGLSEVLGGDGAERFVAGVKSAIAAADRALADQPPSAVSLVRQLNDPEVRRGAAPDSRQLG